MPPDSLWHDDVKGHAQLARATSIPVALGEQLYTVDAFAEFVAQQAIHWVQPDVTRMAGLTEVHVHLAYGHTACQVLEYIPWIKDSFTEPAEVVDGSFRLPELAGAGTTPTAAAWERYQRPCS